MMLLLALAVNLIAQATTPPQPAPSKPIGSFDDSGSAPQSLRSVGIRGTIDAGGYAASAAVKTQTQFFEQLTELQISVLKGAWAPGIACLNLDSPLRKPIDLLAREDYTAAAAMLETLLNTNQEPAVRELLGLADEGIGQLGAAAEQFRIAGRNAPTADAAITAHAIALMFQGEADRAQALCRSASEQSGPKPHFFRVTLGAALFQNGNVAEALRLFLNEAIAEPGADAPFQFIAIAVRSADLATLTRTIDLLTSLSRKSASNGSVHYALACALTAAAGGAPDRSQLTSIESELRRAVTLRPSLADAHVRLGAIYAEREDLSSAITEYRSAMESNPRLADAHYRLGQLYNRTGQPQLARTQLELHKQIQESQKIQIESGRIPVHLPISGQCQP